jgi:hypothetical protein
MSTPTASSMDDQGRGANVGWIAGFLVILATLALGAVLWFSHHP